MANQKISQLTAASTANAADNLLLTQSGSSLSLTLSVLRSEYIEPALDIDKVPFTSITGTITATNVGDAIREVQNELLALDADSVAFSSTTGGLVASNVGDALRELQDSLDADYISFSSVTGGITANNVGDALRELQDEILDRAWQFNGDDIYYAAGNVGVGTSAPNYPLDVDGIINSNGFYLEGIETEDSYGINWTSRTSAADNAWHAVTYGNGLFVAVAASGTGDRVMTSPDGINWTSRTSAADNAWHAVTYGNGLFVAVASSGTGNRVMTSPDGINWTSRTSAADNNWYAVTYGNGLFVAVANSGTGDRVMTSPDGINWTSRTSAADNTWYSVTYGNGLFVAVAASGAGNRVMTSPDGINWTSRTSAAGNAWFSVTYGNGLFVAVAYTGTGDRVMTSPDGINWTSRTSAADNNWYSVTYGNGLFVAVAYTGTGDRVMTSGKQRHTELQHNNQLNGGLTITGDVGIGVSSASAQLDVAQSSSTAAIPVLEMTQADVSEDFVRFIGSAAAATLTQSIVAETDVSTATREGFLKIYVQDDGNQVADSFYFIPFYSLT